MEFKTDSAGQEYVDVRVNGTEEHVRLTAVPDGGYSRPAIRVQIRVANGQLRPGPELPREQLGEFIAAMVDLATSALERR